MSDPAHETCSLCSSAVPPEHLESGLAVRVSGALVCALCVDTLPTDARIRIDQLRAMRGIDTTPYRYQHARFPALQLFTFTTAAQVMRHRRLVDAGETLQAPRIGPRGAPRRAAGNAPQAIPGEPRRNRALALIAGALVLVATTAVMAWTLRDRPEGAAHTEDAHRADTPDPDTTTPGPRHARDEFPARPDRAWAQASTRLAIDDPVLIGIAEEVHALRTPQLDRAATAIAYGETGKARDLLDRMRLASHPLLNRLERRELALRDALHQAEVRIAARQDREGSDAADESDDAPPPPPTDEPVAPVAESTPEPEVTERTPDTGAEPEGTAEETPVSPTVAEDTPPAPAAILIEATALPADDDPAWATDGDTLTMTGGNGSCERTLALAAGAYHAWIALDAAAPTDGRLLLTVGEHELPLPRDASAGWHRLDTAPLDLPATPEVQLNASGAGWAITSLALTASPTPPEASTAAAARFAPAEALTDAPVDADDHVTVTDIDLVFHGDAIPFTATDLAVPSGAPSGVDRVYASPRGDFRTLTLQFPAVDARGGGFAILMHPLNDRRREAMDVELQDAAGRRMTFEAIPIEPRRWQVLLLDASARTTDGFDLAAVERLTIRDRNRKSILPFMLAGARAIGGRAPRDADLALTPRALRMPDTHAFRQVLGAIARVRGGTWFNDLDPQRLQILVGHQLLTSSWRGALYDFFETATGDRPRGLISALVMHDAWLDDTFIIPPAILDTRYHLVVVGTGGVEFAIGLDRRQALENFWAKMLEETVASGTLPVVVLGPTKIQEHHHEETQQLWQDLDSLLADEHPGIPVIDLRGVGVAPYARFGPGQGRTSAHLLAEAVLELQTRMDAIQSAIRDRLD